MVKNFKKYLEAHLEGCKIPYMHTQSNFKEDFFLVWAKKHFFELLRPFFSVINDLLNFFAIFGTLNKNY